ncbi:hypothetical protein YC2023_059858 [Brassica napus]
MKSRVVRTVREGVNCKEGLIFFIFYAPLVYGDDEHDLKIGVLRRSRQLLPAFAEIAYLPRLHQDHKRERESFFSQRYPDLVGDDVELQDDSMTEVIV